MNDNDGLAIPAAAAHASLPAACALCHRFFSPDNEDGDLQTVTICGDCKFLLLEDHETPVREDYRTMIRRLRARRRDISSESIEDLFSQQFSHVINQARQNQSTSFEHDNLMIHGDATLLGRRTSTRTTPSGSRRWRRALSDTESDGFDSFFGESESNFSFSSSRFFHDENDAISVGPYEGGSDASADENAFLENEDYSHPDGASENETDNDIDPMHAGLYHWNSEDIEEDVNGYFGWEDMRIQERARGTYADVFANLEELAEQSYIRSPGDYLHARGFEVLLEHLAEAENSRRGAPPAAISFVRNLTHVLVSGDPEKLDGLACAICKDSLPVGTVVNQLPCLHVYHPSCILPWLSSRNSCPLCRYELPTDDKDYEGRKRRNHVVLNISEAQQQEIIEDSSSSDENNVSEEVNPHLVGESSGRENTRRGWVFLVAAAPVLGAVVMVCLGNRMRERRWRGGGINLSEYGRHPSPLRDGGQNRSWWFLF